MKTFLRVVSVVLVLAVVGGAAHLVNKLLNRLGGVESALTDMKKQDEESKKINAALHVENAQLMTEVVGLHSTIATLKTEKLALKRERDEKTAENNELREDLKTAPPETVLESTKTYLNTQEIWLRLNAVQETEALFSLAAFRLNVDVLAEHHDFKFSLVPSLQSDLKKTEDALANSEEAERRKDVIIVNKDIELGEKDKQLLRRDRVIDKALKFSLVKDVGLPVLAFVLGYLLGK